MEKYRQGVYIGTGPRCDLSGIVLRFFYLGEAIIVAIVLAIVPYVILRGIVRRIARKWLGATGCVLGAVPPDSSER